MGSGVTEPPRPTGVLLTKDAWSRHRDRLVSAAPSATWLVVAEDRTVRPASGGGEAAPTVAWLTADLYDTPGPARAFFGLVRRERSLEWVQTSSAGVDSPFFAELVGRGVRVTNSHIYAGPIGEYVLRAVLDHFQGAAAWRAAQLERQWRVHDVREVEGTTWLVVGYGDIGQGIGQRAQALGARVIGARRHPRGDEGTDRMILPDGLLDVVPEADVVVLAAPSTAATVGLVD